MLVAIAVLLLGSLALDGSLVSSRFYFPCPFGQLKDLGPFTAVEDTVEIQVCVA